MDQKVIDKPKINNYLAKFRNFNENWFKKMPKHVSLILDGNRRFSQKYNLPLSAGHLFGLFNSIYLSQLFFNFNVKEVTVWGFALTNFKRSEFERNTIFTIFNFLPMIFETCYGDWLKKFEIKFSIAGNLDLFPVETQIALESLSNVGILKDPKRYLNFCIGYGFEDELWRAYLKANEKHEYIKSIDQIFDELDIKHKVDLFIRPGKEMRDSAFLPIQAAQAEKYYIPKFLPELTLTDVIDILDDFTNRDIRLGGGKSKKMPVAKNVITKDLKNLSPKLWDHARNILDDIKKYIDWLYFYTDI
jgi:undecaprenyl diphosphate synthase